MASRLSSNPLTSVIVLEAGTVLFVSLLCSYLLLLPGEAHEEDDPKIAYIGKSRLQLGDPKVRAVLSSSRTIHIANLQYDYAFRTIPQVHTNGRQYLWARGKGLGPHSSICTLALYRSLCYRYCRGYFDYELPSMDLAASS